MMIIHLKNLRRKIEIKIELTKEKLKERRYIHKMKIIDKMIKKLMKGKFEFKGKLVQ